ncbi:hypothetical protein [Dyadobacter sp. SG02]|uniref:hypothetical protein n=1 Tax=Dyadobacter sp. SG02 TaxID=1855291 RepID=UPI000B830F45|nr:hypothetical protein [Dyadobacter sp. SG02]
MKQIRITDHFLFFVNNYGVDERSIFDTFDTPDKEQRISQTRTLFYKYFPDRRLHHLLICVKKINTENRLSFAFWLPEQTLCIDMPLEATLAVFCQTFGFTIDLQDVSAKYIESVELNDVSVDDIGKLIRIDAWEDTPIFRHYIASATWSKITLTHIFAINQYQYQCWYGNIEVLTIDIHSEWRTYVNNIIENLNPIEKTKLEIITAKKNPLWDVVSLGQTEPMRETFVTFPKLYKNELNAIIDSLQRGGNVFVSPKINTGCIFCGNKSKSQEHILPTWFRNYFPEYSFDSITHHIPLEKPISSYEYGLSKGKERSYGITTYDVCVKCNNEWMSELENDVKNIITRNSNDLKYSHELALTPINRQMLSRWLICKVLLLAMRVRLLPPLTQKATTDLRKGKIGDGFLVEIHGTQHFGLNYQLSVQSPSVNINKKNDGSIAQLQANLFVAVIHIGFVFYRISHWAHENKYPRTNVWPNTFSIHPVYSQLSTTKAANLGLDNIDSNSELQLFLRSLEVANEA